jgi:hypothetical protein
MDAFLAIMLCLLAFGIIFVVVPYLAIMAYECVVALIDYLKYK